MVMLGVGILTFGQAYSDANIASGSTRTGARLASAAYAPATDKAAAATAVLNAVASDMTNLRSATPVQVWLYKADPTTGLPPSGNFTSCSGNCIKWTYNSTTKTWGSASGNWSSPDGCGADVDYVGVWEQTNLNLNTAFFGNRTLTVNQRTVMRIEPVVTTLC